VAGDLEVTHAEDASGAPQSRLSIDWVTEAADRIWVIEAAWNEPGTLDLAAARDAVQAAGVAPLAIDTDPDEAAVTADALATSAPTSVIVIGQAPWWSGPCNVDNHTGAKLVNSS